MTADNTDALTIAQLRADLAAARLTAAEEADNAARATQLAQRVQAHLAEVAAEVVADRDREIQYVNDALQCALLELGTDWEAQP